MLTLLKRFPERGYIVYGDENGEFLLDVAVEREHVLPAVYHTHNIYGAVCWLDDTGKEVQAPILTRVWLWGTVRAAFHEGKWILVEVD